MFEEALHGRLLESRGRLVEDQKAGADRQGPRDLDDLALLDRQPARLLVDVEIESPVEHQLVRPVTHRAPVDEGVVTRRRRLRENVLGTMRGGRPIKRWNTQGAPG